MKIKTKRNKKFVTNKHKKNKKLINKSAKKFGINNKNFTRKNIQKGGAGVYDKIRLNIKDIRECLEHLTQEPIHYDPTKDDYEPSINRAMKSASKVLTFNPRPNFNCIDTLKYYNTAKLSFLELENYLQFYKIYSERFGMNESLNIYLLGHLYIFHELYYRVSNIQNLNQLFSSVNPTLIESFVCGNPAINFFWINYYKNKSFSTIREGTHEIKDKVISKIKGVDAEDEREDSSLPFKIKRAYIDYITLKDPHNLTKIFEEYSPYYSPIEYLGLTNDSGRDIVSRDEFKFKIKNLENIDDLLNKNNYRSIRNFENVRLLTDSPLLQEFTSEKLTSNRINLKWDLIFDIPYDNANLNVIHNFYNENRDEDIQSFFKDSFIRAREFIYIEKNGKAYLMDEPDMYESVYKFILARIGFPEDNIELCLKNLRDYIKAYFLSKNPYLFDCLNIKTFVPPEFVDVYGVFSSYTDENKINTGQLQTNITNKITWRNNESKPDLIEIINRFVSSNTENKLSGFAKHSNEENDISCDSAFYNIIENGRQRGFGACLFNLICIGATGQLILAHISQVTIYSKNDNQYISEFQLKYLLIWNNKDDVVYKEIDYIDITENFRNCFLKPIFTPLSGPLSNPVDMPRVNINPTPDSNRGWKISENFRNVFNRKPAMPPSIDYDQSKIREIDPDVRELPRNNPPLTTPEQSVKSGFLNKTFKNIFTRKQSEQPMPVNYVEPSQNQYESIAGVPGKHVSGQIVLGGKKYKSNTNTNTKKRRRSNYKK